MTSKDSFTLQHNKYVAYLQIWAAFCLAIMAGSFFGIIKIQTYIFPAIFLNNFIAAVVLGFVGLLFFRSQMHQLENRIRLPRHA